MQSPPSPEEINLVQVAIMIGGYAFIMYLIAAIGCQRGWWK